MGGGERMVEEGEEGGGGGRKKGMTDNLFYCQVKYVGHLRPLREREIIFKYLN